MTQAEKDQMNADLDETLADMTADTTLIDGWQTFVDSLKKQIADLLAANDVPAPIIAKVSALVALQRTNTAKLVAASQVNVA